MKVVDEGIQPAGGDERLMAARQRLRQRCIQLERAYGELRSRFEQAAVMEGDVQAVIDAYESSIEALEGESMKRLMMAIGQEVGSQAWSGEVAWRCRFELGLVKWEGEELDLDRLVQRVLPMGVLETRQGQGVTYPIIFSHQAEKNIRAVQLALMWSALGRWCAERIRGQEKEASVALVEGDRRVIIDEEGITAMVRADDLGWKDHSEIDARIEGFVQRDPGAHRQWVEAKRQPGETQRFLFRDPRGATVAMECQPRWRRVVIRRREATEVFRHRRDVFAEQGQRWRKDLVAADEEALEECWQRCVERWVEQGFRLVEVEEA